MISGTILQDQVAEGVSVVTIQQDQVAEGVGSWIKYSGKFSPGVNFPLFAM